MKQVFSRPVSHIVPLAEGIDARTLVELPEQELAQAWYACRQAEDCRVFQVNPDIIPREIGDEWMLIPTGTFAQNFNGMISQNEFSHFVWHQFAEPRAIAEVMQAVHAEYEDATHVMDVEVHRLIEDYVNMGLLLEKK